jgi:transposase-like protein
VGARWGRTVLFLRSRGCPPCRPFRRIQGYRRFRCRAYGKQFNEETYIKMHGHWRYLYRAIAKEAYICGFLLVDNYHIPYSYFAD